MGIAAISIAIGVSGFVFAAGCFLLRLLDGYHRVVEARLHELPKATTSPNSETSGPLGNAVVKNACDRLLPSGSDRQNVSARLQRAGFYGPRVLVTFYAARLLCLLAPFTIALAVASSGYATQRTAMIVGCITGIICVTLPSIWLHSRVVQRQKTLKRSLPDFLDLMVVCLQSGLSIQSTIQRVADELRIAFPLLAEELGVVQRDIDLGATVDVAFKRFADRSGVAPVRSLSSFIREAQRYGSELVEALRSHAEMMRHQREQLAEEMAQKASVKILFPTLLLILPGVFVVLVGPAAIMIQEAFSK